MAVVGCDDIDCVDVFSRDDAPPVVRGFVEAVALASGLGQIGGQLGGQLGGIIAMQPSTGQILAVAGLGLDGLQPPGSTFKMITTTGVLSARIANEHKADLFLSIHANSSPVKSVTGVETYYLNFTTSRTALDVAARENATAESSIFDLKDVLEKIALKDKIDESREFASRLQTSLRTLTKASPATKNRGIKKAPFVVLIGASMPSVLAEIGFLSVLHT